ncbi:hypothetical protein [Chitinophaga qingshengii]|uniref:Uncharacterized protein n=1 Tax=Chitinophaga qingshengii TaxID=1569794 RepID=A0ABR7TYS5_9BACT|nr:hypothetical protein [Chitinophaga qingshengii]MBC9934709.1 hypothetical protein [Chitinophaga qingshengii]
MIIAKQLTGIIESLQQATNRQQVSHIIDGISGEDTVQLKTWLESQSPLEWNSTQWDSFRYALICLRKCPELL